MSVLSFKVRCNRRLARRLYRLLRTEEAECAWDELPQHIRTHWIAVAAQMREHEGDGLVPLDDFMGWRP